MATISAANAQALADSIAKHLIDTVALVGSTAGITTGQATTLGKIAALNDASQQFTLLDAFEQAVTAENSWLAQIAAYTGILDIWAAACASLEAATGGLHAFIVANSLQVDPHYLDAHNRAAQRRSMVSLTNYDAFAPVASNMGQIAVTGAAAGTFSAGTPPSSTYGNGPLTAYNAGGSATGASSTVLLVTYSAYVAGVLTPGLTHSVTIPNATAAGAGVSVGVSGVAVTNISVTSGGNSGDTLAVKATLLRTVTY